MTCFDLRGTPVIIGFCLPKGAETKDPQMLLNFEGRWGRKKNQDTADVVLADSMEDLESDSTGKNTFLDTTRRQEKPGFSFY